MMVDPLYHRSAPEELDYAVVTARLTLELEYDRPSMHSEDPTTLGLGRTFAIMDRHIDTDHPEVRDGTVAWYDRCCEFCGFDVSVELRRLYPEELDNYAREE